MIKVTNVLREDFWSLLDVRAARLDGAAGARAARLRAPGRGKLSAEGSRLVAAQVRDTLVHMGDIK